MDFQFPAPHHSNYESGIAFTQQATTSNHLKITILQYY